MTTISHTFKSATYGGTALEKKLVALSKVLLIVALLNVLLHNKFRSSGSTFLKILKPHHMSPKHPRNQRVMYDFTFSKESFRE